MENKHEIFREMIESSRTKKHGLTFFIGGQTLAGVVVDVIGQEALVIKSQLYSKAIIRLDAIDAIGVS